MQIIRYLPGHSDDPTAVAIGNFDGVHLGHRAVIRAMVRAARVVHAVPSVLTFEPHPRLYFKPDSPNFRIAPLRDKLAALRSLGVHRVYIPRFDAAFATIQPEDFLNRVLMNQLGARVVVTGENFVFGHRRRGNGAMLKAWGMANKVKVTTVAPVAVDGQICSSSVVREALEAGDMAQAAALLGRTYRISGHVVHGAGRGRQLGFPTANIGLPAGLMLPAYGVYAVRASLDGKLVDGVANVGMRPTIGGYTQPALEVHLFDVMQDIYGKLLQVSFVRHLRPEVKFDGLEALTRQIHLDCETAKQVLRAA